MNINNLTILILTHNRPQLFYRLFNIIKQYECEIIVNNDSNDVLTLPNGNYKNIRLFHNKFSNLSDIYKFLILKVNTSWFYILEDDDIPLNFFKAFVNFSDLNFNDLNFNDLNFDAIVGSYFTFDKRFVKYDLESKDFQLSQIIFKNKTFNFNSLYDRCNGDCIYNDYYFVKENIFNPFVTNYCFYKQTVDGKDNISFPEYNKKFNLNICKKCKYIV